MPIGDKARVSFLLVTMSMLMVGCGGGSGSNHNTDSSGSNTNLENNTVDVPIDTGETAKPVICSATQYLDHNSCKDKTIQTLQPLYIQRFIKGQAYELSLTTNQNLAVTLSSESPTICNFRQGELKTLALGQCRLTLAQQGTYHIAPFKQTLVIDVVEADKVKDLNACKAGEVSELDRQTFIRTVNEIRALHHLPAVTYSTAHEDQMLQAALLIAVNEKSSHYPDNSWTCFSDIGYQGASTSNLNTVWSSGSLDSYGVEQHINAWLTEKNSVSLGHRRYLLSPYLTQIAYAEVSNTNAKRYNSVVGSAMKVIFPYEQTARTTTVPAGVIAYPYHHYPAKFVLKSEPLSLSILAKPQNASDNRLVDFSKASLQVIRRDNQQIQTITDIQYDNNNYGHVANNLQFKFTTMEFDVTYDVTIKNVLIDGKSTDYTYWFNVNTP